MLMNRLEYHLMNNPVRAALQRHIEAPRLQALAGSGTIGRALEIGCGRGVGIGIIRERFKAHTVDAFDMDPRMVRTARRRWLASPGSVRLWVGDAAAVSAPDASYDAVFDFGILHHVPDWRSAVRETARVLKPGGRLYGEEVLAPFIRLMRRVLVHPDEDRFDTAMLTGALSEAGFVDVRTRAVGNLFLWFTAVRGGAGWSPETAARMPA